MLNPPPNCESYWRMLVAKSEAGGCWHNLKNITYTYLSDFGFWFKTFQFLAYIILFVFIVLFFIDFILNFQTYLGITFYSLIYMSPLFTILLQFHLYILRFIYPFSKYFCRFIYIFLDSFIYFQNTSAGWSVGSWNPCGALPGGRDYFAGGESVDFHSFSSVHTLHALHIYYIYWLLCRRGAAGFSLIFILDHCILCILCLPIILIMRIHHCILCIEIILTISIMAHLA